MSLTDAISVACKALGFAADVYWNSDKTKYTKKPDAPPSDPPPKEYKCVLCGKPFEAFTAPSTGVHYTKGQAYHISERKNIDKNNNPQINSIEGYIKDIFEPQLRHLPLRII